jgi:hypothetical protein
VTDRAPELQNRDRYARAHERYLSRLETLNEEWGALAYCARAEAAPSCPAGAADWTEEIPPALGTLIETGQLDESFSLLEIAPGLSSLAPVVADEFPRSTCYVLCPERGSCTVHRFAEDDPVRVYAADLRQLFNSSITGKRQSRAFDVALVLEPSVLSPLERANGVDRYLPELALDWLGRNARFAFAVLHAGRRVEDRTARRISVPSSGGVAVWMLPAGGDEPGG